MMGYVGSRWVPRGQVRVPYGPVWVRKSYTDAGPGDSRVIRRGSRAISGSDGFPSEPCFGTTGTNKARRVARLSRIGAQLMYGPIREPTASPRAHHDGPPAAVGPRLIGASLVRAARSSYWRSRGYLFSGRGRHNLWKLTLIRSCLVVSSHGMPQKRCFYLPDRGGPCQAALDYARLVWTPHFRWPVLAQPKPLLLWAGPTPAQPNQPAQSIQPALNHQLLPPKVMIIPGNC